MRLSREEVIHIARLARVGVTEEDINKFQEQLSNIIENFEALNLVDTENVPPTAQSIPLQNIYRKDEVVPSLTPEQVLANASQKEDNFIRIHRVLED